MKLVVVHLEENDIVRTSVNGNDNIGEPGTGWFTGTGGTND